MSTINHQAMTEAHIERVVERQMDRFDARYMRGEYTTEQYENEVARLDWWAKNELRKAKYQFV